MDISSFTKSVGVHCRRLSNIWRLVGVIGKGIIWHCQVILHWNDRTFLLKPGYLFGQPVHSHQIRSCWLVYPYEFLSYFVRMFMPKNGVRFPYLNIRKSVLPHFSIQGITVCSWLYWMDDWYTTWPYIAFL